MVPLLLDLWPVSRWRRVIQYLSLKQFRRLSSYLEIPYTLASPKLVGLGCGCASVMTDCCNAVYALLKKEQPSIVVIHCFAHHFEPAFKDACKLNVMYDKVVTTLLMGLHYFYHKSAVNRAMLKWSAACLWMNLLIPTHIAWTRWVGHLRRALQSTIKSFPVILLHPQQLFIVNMRCAASIRNNFSVPALPV